MCGSVCVDCVFDYIHSQASAQSGRCKHVSQLSSHDGGAPVQPVGSSRHLSKSETPSPHCRHPNPHSPAPTKMGFMSVLRKGLIWLVGRVQSITEGNTFASQSNFGDFGFIWCFYLSLGNVSWLCRFLLYSFLDNLASFLLSCIQCLEKFPVIQHFKFGSLLSIQPVKPWHSAAHAKEGPKSWPFSLFLRFLLQIHNRNNITFLVACTWLENARLSL